MKRHRPLFVCLFWFLVVFFGYNIEAMGDCVQYGSDPACSLDKVHGFTATLAGGSACDAADPYYHILTSADVEPCQTLSVSFTVDGNSGFGSDIPIGKQDFPQGGEVMVEMQRSCGPSEWCTDYCGPVPVYIPNSTQGETCDGVDNNCNGLVDEVGCTCESKGGGPINIFTGKMDHSIKLFDFSSPGINLGFSLNYKTSSLMTKSIGMSSFAGWRHSYEMELKEVDVDWKSFVYLYTSNGLVVPYVNIYLFGSIYDPNGLHIQYIEANSSSSSVLPFLTVKQMQFIKSDGTALAFFEASDRINYYPTKGNKASLQRQAGGGYLLLDEDGLEYNFDSGGNILSIRDTNCNWIQYSSSGSTHSITNNYGQTIQLVYSGSILSKVIDPAGHEYKFEYSGGNLSKLTLPDDDSNPDNNPFYGFVYGFTFYGKGTYLTQLTDPMGRKTNWSYDSHLRAISSSLEGGIGQVSIAYQADGLGTKVTDSRGNVKEYKIAVDLPSRTQKMTVTGGGCSSCSGQGVDTEYDYITGEIRNTTDQNGVKTIYEDYDAHGRGQHVIEAANTTTPRVTDYEYHQILGTPIQIMKKSLFYPTNDCSVNPDHCKTTIYDYDDPSRSGDNPNVPNEAPTPYLYKVIEKGFTYNPSTLDLSPFTYITSYNYNAAHQLILMDGPRTDANDVTIYEYYLNETAQGSNRGRLKSTTDGLGHQTVYSDYDAYGNISKITDPNGLVTTFSYNARNKLSQMTVILSGSEGSLVTHYYYDKVGNLDYIILPKGNVIGYGYDAADRITSITRRVGPGAGSTAIDSISYKYDHEGNRLGEYYWVGEPKNPDDPSNIPSKKTEFKYDQYNKLAQILNPGGSHQDFQYDPNGNRTALSDENSNQTSYSYDSLNHLIKVSQPETLNFKPETNYSYDPLDNLKTVTDALSHSTQYIYDDLGRLVQANSPDTGTTYYFYDAAGNLIKKKDAKNQETTYSYDDLNRLIAIIPPPPAGGGAGEGVNYTYDETTHDLEATNGKGRLTTIVDASGTTNLFYDLKGNVVKEVKNVGSPTPTLRLTTVYQYDANGNLSNVIYPGGRGLIYNFSSTDLDRVASISGTVNGVSTPLASDIEYVPYGGISHIKYGNNVETTITRDDRYQITDILSKLGTTELLNYTYGYDSVGNITSIEDKLFLDHSKDRVFTYDSLNRLGSGTGVWGTLDWNYDGVGNRDSETKNGDAVSYGYDPGTNKLETVGSAPYVHDNNGNITQVTFPNASYPKVVTQYVYNADNRLVEVKENSATVATYIYDYQGRRIKKTAGGVETIYLYDLFGSLIYEYNKTANKTSEHVYLGSERIARIDNSNPVIAMVPWYDQPKKRTVYAGGFLFGIGFVVVFGWVYARNGNKKYLVLSIIFLVSVGGVFFYILLRPSILASQPTSEQVYFYHNDHLGTPIKMTDANGAVAWAADYLPFGEVKIDPASTITNNFRFPGQYYDEETGLNYNFLRYYSPFIGRYIQPDSISIENISQIVNYYQNELFKEEYVIIPPNVLINSSFLYLIKPLEIEMSLESSDISSHAAFFTLLLSAITEDSNYLNKYVYALNNSFLLMDFYGLDGNLIDKVKNKASGCSKPDKNGCQICGICHPEPIIKNGNLTGGMMKCTSYVKCDCPNKKDDKKEKMDKYNKQINKSIGK